MTAGQILGAAAVVASVVAVGLLARALFVHVLEQRDLAREAREDAERSRVAADRPVILEAVRADTDTTAAGDLDILIIERRRDARPN